jgi:hypothetical protein
MAILYHSSTSGILEGSEYRGSDRGYLSVVMSGKVGFAYGFLPDCWVGKKGVYEIILDDDALVWIGMNGYDVPRVERYGTSSSNPWETDCKLCTAAEAVQLADPTCEKYGEVVFLASEAKFGKELFKK